MQSSGWDNYTPAFPRDDSGRAELSVSSSLACVAPASPSAEVSPSSSPSPLTQLPAKVTISTPRVKAETSAPPSVIPQKRKSALDQLQDTRDADRKVRIEVERIKAQSKYDRENLRLQSKAMRDAEHRAADERRREHELALMDKQIELARLKAHYGAIDPSLL